MDDGLVDEARWQKQQDDYLLAATQVWHPGSPLNVLDHLERRRRDPGHTVDIEAIGEPELARWFDRIDQWKDCADFDVLRLLHLWYGHQDELSKQVRRSVAERLTGFKYWYTEPTPDGVVDQRWYWSENHRLIFHTIEYLAGEAFQDETFGSDGATGAEHRQRARSRLDAWFDEKARLGFSEWHSDVYYEKDLAPLLTLAEWAGDPALSERAATFLDLLLFDIALHLHRGNLGATHGRSYMKDKSRATDQPIFSAAKLCFADTDLPWPVDLDDDVDLTPLHEGAVLLARARRYRPPEVLRRVATHDEPMVDREGMGLDLDPSEPLCDEPVRADGLSYRDPELVPFWWDRGALTPWQLVPLALDTMDRHRLWDAELFAPFRGVRDVTSGDRELTRKLAHDLAPIVNAGLLTRVDTHTYRTAHVMLSTAQSYRPGWAGYQHHIWQATLDERAVVFTTHPANEPSPGADSVLDLGHYWTGTATLPRSLQHGAAAIHQYAPAYPPPELRALETFRYLPMTHAFFPTEHFDEITGDEHWTLGHRGKGYVALWSWRPVRWRRHDPSQVHTNGLTEPFDLVAEGGAANVWVVEVGDARRWGDFETFRAAILASTPEVVELGPAPSGAHGGFEVAYRSPAEGTLACSWEGPLTVDGGEILTGGYNRFDNPFARVVRGETTVEIRDGEWSLRLDLAAGTRDPRGPAQAVTRRPRGTQ